MRRTITGFTIVELLIVIVVIGVLAGIVSISYNSFQNNARAAAIESGLKDTEKALRAYAAENKWSVWPPDSGSGRITTSVTGNPTISQLITHLPGFSDYLPTAPTVSGMDSLYWFYDFDNDTRGTCGSKYAGTNIIIRYMPQDLATQIDNDIDDGDDRCGRVRYDGTTNPSDPYFFYSLSYGKELECLSGCTN